MTFHRDVPYLMHILDAIRDIEESIKPLSKKEFETAKDAKDATIRRVEIIGEAVKNLSSNLKKNHPEVEWKKIAGTRDRITHAYFAVDLDIIWEIVKHSLPVLKKQIQKIVKDLKEA